jgi:hypothetical protein
LADTLHHHLAGAFRGPASIFSAASSCTSGITWLWASGVMLIEA